MITSEEARKLVRVYSYNERLKLLDYITQQEAITKERDTLKKMYDDYFIQNETLRKLTTAVKRYFELKAKGITTEAEALEHRELLNKINEILNIKEK